MDSEETPNRKAIAESLRSSKQDKEVLKIPKKSNAQKIICFEGKKSGFEVGYDIALDQRKCVKCFFVSHDQGLALRHLRSTHIIFSCNFCLKKLTSRQYLRNPRERKRPETSSAMKCPICPKTSSEIHVGQCWKMEDFVCPTCEKPMTRNGTTLSRWRHKIQFYRGACKRWEGLTP